MHIGFLTCDLNPGHGWGRYTVNLIDALRAQGVRVTAVASRNSPTDLGYPVHPLLPNVTPAERFTLPRLLWALPAARSALADCDIIHTAIEPFAPLGMWLRGNRPHFITGHGTYVALPVMRKPPINALYRAAFEDSTAIACNGYYTENRLKQAVPDAKSCVVLLGIDAAKQITHLSMAEPMPKRGPTVLFLPALKVRKGALQLVRAIAFVRQSIPDVQCVLVGRTNAEPSYTQRVMDEIAALGLHDCVHLTGFISDPLELARWYKTADVFALPSFNNGWQFEGFGLVHLEAGLAGVPVIGTRDCGAQDAIDEGVTGLLVSQENIEAELPEALLTLLNNPELRSQMGTAGHEKAAKQTWERVAHEMIGLYEAALR